MTETVTRGTTDLKVGDTVEVKEGGGWDEHRGWVVDGTRVTLTASKPTGGWVGEENLPGKRTVTIPANTNKHVKKI
jgi:hypothetical protein